MKKKLLTKAVFIGDQRVGKTSILKAYQQNLRNMNYRETIGSDFYAKEFLIDEQNHSKFWDTAGQERFLSLGAPYFRGAQCCVIVFDLTNRKSFAMLDFWRDEFIQNSRIEQPDDFPFVILGNKLDLVKREEVGDTQPPPQSKSIEPEEAEQWCGSRGNVRYFQTSIENPQSLDKAFQFIARQTLPPKNEGGQENQPPQPQSVILGKDKPKDPPIAPKSGGCC